MRHSFGSRSFLQRVCPGTLQGVDERVPGLIEGKSLSGVYLGGWRRWGILGLGAGGWGRGLGRAAAVSPLRSRLSHLLLKL